MGVLFMLHTVIIFFIIINTSALPPCSQEGFYKVKLCPHFQLLDRSSFVGFIGTDGLSEICNNYESAINCTYDIMRSIQCPDYAYLAYDQVKDVIKVICGGQRKNYEEAYTSCLSNKFVKALVEKCIDEWIPSNLTCVDHQRAVSCAVEKIASYPRCHNALAMTRLMMREFVRAAMEFLTPECRIEPPPSTTSKVNVAESTSTLTTDSNTSLNNARATKKVNNLQIQRNATSGRNTTTEQSVMREIRMTPGGNIAPQKPDLTDGQSYKGSATSTWPSLWTLHLTLGLFIYQASKLASSS